MNIEIREMLESYKRLYRELDETGGPGNNGELFETIIGLEEEILEVMELPPAQKYRTILWGKDMDDVISKLNEAREEYDSRPIRDTTLILVDAILNHIDEPENILPMVGLSHHSYQIFLFSKKLLASGGPAETDDIIAEMKKAEEYLNELGLLEVGGIKEYPELYLKLREAGMDNLDEFLMYYDKFDLDNEDMDVRQFYLRGIINGKKGRIDDAIRDFTTAIEFRPDIASIYYNRGLTYDEKGKIASAADDYTRVIELDPEHYMALCNRGVILAFADLYNEALDDFNRAIAIRPNMSCAYTNRGNLYAVMEKHEMAVEDYTRAITLNPDIAYLYCNRGVSFFNLGNKERALEDLERSAAMGHDLAKEALEEFFNTRRTQH